MAPRLFAKGFPQGGGPCTCTSTCCEGGVYADVRERDRIMEHKEMVKKYMDATQTQDDTLWFEKEELDDPDFVSRKCVGTTEINKKCVFLDGKGRCSLQVAAAAEGMHKWAIKPLFCVLFPIEITNNVVDFDDMLQEEQPCCTVKETFDMPLFRGCKEELVYLVGDDGYEMMERHYASLKGTGHGHP